MFDGFMEQEGVWDAIARPWKKFRHHKISHIVNFLKGKEGRILDLGCGSGRNFIIDDGLEFYGVDFSKEMIKLAKKRGIAKEVKKGDVCAIPYDDMFFNFVIFNAVLHCIEGGERRREALKEIYRVLKNGGEALISVWGRGQERMKNREKESFVPWSVEGEKVERYTYIYDEDELVRDLKSVGFKIVNIKVGKNIVVIARKS